MESPSAGPRGAEVPDGELAPAVRGVTFDLDDTLWCGRAVIQRASEAFHAFVAVRAPAAAARFPPGAFYAEMVRFQRELPDRAHDYTFLRKHTLRACLQAAADAQDEARAEAQIEAQVEAQGQDEAAAQLRALVLDQARLDAFVDDAFQAFLLPRSRPEFFAGALELLDALETELAPPSGSADAVTLGAVTNGNCVLAELPAAFRRRVRFVVSAEGVGVAKPRPEIFDAAVARFPPGVRRAQLVHVGDHYSCDVEGAKRAGLRTVWVNAAWRGPDVLRARPGAAFEPVDAAQVGEEEQHEEEEQVEEEDERPASERFPDADAIVRQVGAVLAVVARWNREAFAC
jgi:FMN phosphatase YigB (HAD superfamily)